MLAPDFYRRLANSYGTPYFIYDARVLADSLRELRGALPAEMEVFYSLKANPNISIFALLRSYGARAEVSSLVELETALRAGAKARDIIFLGPGKSRQELAACVGAGIYAVVVESLPELDELNRCAAATGIRQRVLLRINPATAAPGSRLTMGGKPRQFGIDESQLLAAGQLPCQYPSLHLAGVHAYLGTRILDVAAVVDNTARVLEMAERVCAATAMDLEAVDVGGGLGVAYFDGESDPDLDQLRTGLHAVVQPFLRRHPQTRLLFESGRYLAARAGTYVIAIRYVKESMGQHFAVTDGGTHHHMAAVGVGSAFRRNFPVKLLGRASDPSTVDWHLTGPLCTPGDTIASHVPLPALRPGDLIGILRSGAYGPTASPVYFLSHGYPAEILVHDGQPYLVRDRDTPDDLLRKQHHHSFARMAQLVD
ncbi:MAG: type III PLP-dependent enzyme [Streptosporangiaceae bacterium]|nr:type III PLP-dependent enzyme [Streptosporangiaceae bacterium]